MSKIEKVVKLVRQVLSENKKSSKRKIMEGKNLASYFNPEVTDLDFQITVPFKVANKTFEFSDYIEDLRYEEYDKPISYNKALSRANKYGLIEVRIDGKKENPATQMRHGWSEGANPEFGDWEDTGDDEETIKDVINWLKRKQYDAVRDFSWEAKTDTYQPAFAQFPHTQD